MPDMNFAAADRFSDAAMFENSPRATERVLVARPDTFFSHQFRFAVEEEETRPAPGATMLDRAINVHLIAIAAFVGGSMLIGWLMS